MRAKSLTCRIDPPSPNTIFIGIAVLASLSTDDS